ncbi:MAG TPA: hopanoid-associated sugar epimerase [Candidatus Saccharimonadales bacterium]|nr:hopanoid-associated sugar epimerase [Candidatus Saccharimonadales bacterium]
MKCFVTGASGFVGTNLVRELTARGHHVKVLLHAGNHARTLAGLALEPVTGDISDPELLKREIAGCDWCFHTAASYHLLLRDYRPMHATNVAGTRNVIEAAGVAGCKRIIYTSTVGCIGLPKSTHNGVMPSDEFATVPESELTNHYKHSKWQAEELAAKLARQGLPVIIVNPSAPVGPYDAKPTPTGRIIVDFLNRKLPAYLDTGLNWIHVRDVAIGHILAAENGHIGERYILGHAQGNWTMYETLVVLSEITGIPSPKLKIPHWLALMAAYLNEGIASVTGREPRVPLAGVRMAKDKMWYSPAKAIRELGLPQTPPKQAFADAAAWFRANGYVKN